MNDKHIILIEDNPDDRDLTIRALKKNGVLNPVSVASNGAEALAMLLGDDQRDRENPALILLDLNLPRSAGSRSSAASAPTSGTGDPRRHPHLLQ